MSFFWEKLQIGARYIIPVAIDDFYKLVKNFGPANEQNILFIHHVGRCGSTLLHKLLGAHVEIESFSEDLIFDNLFYFQDMEFAERARMCHAILSLVTKKLIGETNKFLVLK